MANQPTKLTTIEQQELASLAMHPGWHVLQRLMEKRAGLATVAVLKVDPTDPDRLLKLSNLQAVAFAMNEGFQDVIKDVNWQIAALSVNDDGGAEEPDAQLKDLIKAGYYRQGA